jgi:quercetin dioxygenase-like cupin family protein
MKTSLMLLAAVSATAAFGVQAQDARDAVAVDPEHHHVILENDRVRVFEVLADVGAKSPMHTHPPFVLVSLGKARLRMTMPDGQKAIFDLNPGQVLWMEGAEHSWELVAGQGHVVAVEVK